MIKKIAKWMSIGILALIAFSVILNIGFFIGFRTGYKEACQDFLNGHLKMDLFDTGNGELEWRWIKPAKFDPRYIPNNKAK